MQIKRFLTLLFFILFFLPAHHHLPVNSFSPHPPRQDGPMRTAAEINRSLGRGINLGNALEAPKGISWGVYLQEEYFTLIKEKGFSSVRIPIRWSVMPAQAPYTIEEILCEGGLGDRGLKTVYVIINFHH